MKFIKLTLKPDGSESYVNISSIHVFSWGTNGEGSSIYFGDSTFMIDVYETPEEILNLIRKAS